MGTTEQLITAHKFQRHSDAQGHLCGVIVSGEPCAYPAILHESEQQPAEKATPSDHVAWLRYVCHGQYEDSGADILTIEVCDSDAEGAFKVYTRDQSAAFDALTEAAEANLAWHVAEELSIGSFQARMELCNYAQWLTRKALGDLSDYEGVPRLLLNTQTFNVDIARCDVNNCKALVKEALDAALRKAGRA